MIEFTEGDLFEVPVDVRVNTVNCVGVMGTGMALAFKNRYPDMFKDYQNACRVGSVRPGNLHVWKSLMGDWVINFPTKRDWRNPSRYEDILSGLEALRNYLRERGPISVALPALGCGHGGLDWDKVSSMIKDSLSDLEARILVFQPVDSRKAGREVQDQPSDEQIQALEALGFKSVVVPNRQEDDELPATVLAKGNPALLARPWVALLPSRKQSEREKTALSAVARQMGLSGESSPVALVYATRSTEQVAELFLKQGVAVILILPFGPLTRKAVARIPTDDRLAPFVLISVAGPARAWGRPILAESMKLLRARASSALLSDPTPDWLNGRTMHSWAERPVFYLRYDNLPDNVRGVLEDGGARPIGRRSETGEPNLTPLFDALAKRGAEPGSVVSQDRFSIPLTAASASKLRDLAAAIERSPRPNGTICVTVPSGPETEDLCADFGRIFTGVERDADAFEERHPIRSSRGGNSGKPWTRSREKI